MYLFQDAALEAIAKEWLERTASPTEISGSY